MQAFQGNLRKVFVLNLAQAAATYDIATATGGDVICFPEWFAWYVDIAGATFTSVSVQTNTASPTILMTSTEGAVANIKVGINISPAWRQPFILRSGGKIQFTMVGPTGTGQITLCTAFQPLTSNGGSL